MNSSVTEKVLAIISSLPSERVSCINLGERSEALNYMTIEMPELMIIHMSDPQLDAFSLVDDMMKDPWFLHGGFIALCDTVADLKRIEEVRGANLILAMMVSDLQEHLAQTLSIILKNRRILFQREISNDIIREISGTFILNNDFYEVRCYVNLICNFLYNANRFDTSEKFRLAVSLSELLVNAIEHGNCEIDFNQKRRWLEEEHDIQSLVRQKLQDPRISARKVIFEYTLSTEGATFHIRDEGNGFCWKEIPDPLDASNLLLPNGRGISISRKMTDSLVFSDKGNEVEVKMKFSNRNENLLKPGLFESVPVKSIEPGTLVFQEGEQSNFIYFIVDGEYSVNVKGKQVSVLTSDDIFMGEMSFLLNNHRSATVIALTSGKLIEISKARFVESIKEYPHYALFLCRLLAQRVVRANMRS